MAEVVLSDAEQVFIVHGVQVGVSMILFEVYTIITFIYCIVFVINEKYIKGKNKT